MARESINLNLTTLNVNGLGFSSKRRAVFNSLRKAKNDICFLQETHSTGEKERIWSAEWGGDIHYAHGSSGARGVAILFARSFSPSIHASFVDPGGRFIILQASIDDWPCTLVNVYAPTADQPDSQIKLLEEIETILHDLDVVNLIIGGDFNCCIDPANDRYRRGFPLDPPTPPSSDRATLCLRSFLEEFSVRDVWRSTNPDSLQFTYRRPNYASRLNYWFVSEHLTEWIRSSEIRPAAQSDHSAVFFSLQTIPITRGPGIWRFDNALLLDKNFINKMSLFLETYVPSEELDSPHVQWDFFKFKIREFCMAYTRSSRASLKSKMEGLRRELTLLERDNPSVHSNKDELYRSKKKELADLELLKANQLIFRARANWAQFGERPNRFFLNLEKRKAKANTFSVALTDDGRSTSDPREILQLTRNFYDNLYSLNSVDLAPLDSFDWKSLDIPQISKEHFDSLEGAYSEREFHRALLSMNRGKSPGSDGLTVDFYVKFWDLLKAPLLDSLNFGLASEELSTDQKRGLITLIPKKGLDRRLIRNWRPISLLNSDNKILAKAMSLRLQPVLREVIHADQTGFLRGRFIGENLRAIQDVIDFSRATSTPALLLALDFCKAFDSLSWQFILRAFREFGFGDNFVSSIKTIFTNIQSAVTNSGFTSDYFSPS